jgi:predicted dehydrogenase
MKPMRVGIVGVGWGALVHAPAFRAVPAFELAALCSQNAARAAEAGQRLGIADVSTDWRAFVRRSDLDLISIATPVGLHRAMAVAALESGKHVLCEKPLALSAPDARAIVDAAERARGVAAVCFELRWTPERLAIWEWVRAGQLGAPYFLRIVQSAGYWHPSHAAQSEWMYKRAEGGGYLMGLQSHDIDFACALLGEPRAVAADLKTTLPRRALADGRTTLVDADDTGTLLLRMESGASVVLSSSVVGAHAAGTSLELFGSDGTLTFDGRQLLSARTGDAGLAPLALTAREPASGAELGQRRSARTVRAQALMLEDWLPAFRGEETPRAVPSLCDGWRVQRVIDAARESAAGAGWVTLR